MLTVLKEFFQLLTNYWWIILILLPIAWIGYYLLIDQRQYKMINGKLHIKEGISKWEDLEEHMDREHKEE